MSVYVKCSRVFTHNTVVSKVISVSTVNSICFLLSTDTVILSCATHINTYVCVFDWLFLLINVNDTKTGKEFQNLQLVSFPALEGTWRLAGQVNSATLTNRGVRSVGNTEHVQVHPCVTKKTASPLTCVHRSSAAT